MKNIFMIVVATFLICGSCEKFPESKYTIRVRNNSTLTISVCAGYLPDTLLPVNKPILKEIMAGKFVDIYDSEVGDEKFEKLKNERITVFILHNDTVKKYDWTTIKSDYKILKRYEFNDKELTEMGGSVSFP